MSFSKSREYKNEWYKNNKHKWYEGLRKQRQNYPEKCLLAQAKNNSRGTEIEFNISIEDIIIPEYCPYLGYKLTWIRGQGRVQTNASIDRINPKLGYIKGNVQIISNKANTMKQDASKEELQTFALNILSLYPLPSL